MRASARSVREPLARPAGRPASALGAACVASACASVVAGELVWANRGSARKIMPRNVAAAKWRAAGSRSFSIGLGPFRNFIEESPALRAPRPIIHATPPHHPRQPLKCKASASARVLQAQDAAAVVIGEELGIAAPLGHRAPHPAPLFLAQIVLELGEEGALP